MAFQYHLGNRTFRHKVDKHTTPPDPSAAGKISWVDSHGDYELFHRHNVASGTVNLDLTNNYLFLWDAPRGDNLFAHVLYGDSGTVIDASGVICPLNSRLQNFHSFFGNWDNSWIPITDSPDVVVEEPNHTHPSVYTVSAAGETIATYDPDTGGFWKKL